MTNTATALIEDLFKDHERFLWGLCYRMTGNAADADDLVQEAFVRAISSPPARLDEPLRPWLVQVAMNLSRDLLRRRKRQAYEGPWLPSPIETGDEASPPGREAADEQANPAARYDLLESVSFAFLLALEALTPAQRAVLLLRDVFDYSVKETAEALLMTESNVKTTHHRARQAMNRYDQSRISPSNELQAQTRRAMEAFLVCLSRHDVAGIESLLAIDVRQLSDGGGEYAAARLPVIGREKVALFNSRIARLRESAEMKFAWRMFNGTPAVIFEFTGVTESYAPRVLTLCELNGEGRISRLYNVLATRKLTAVRPVD
ncbi:MAG TPA: sigma-70 family RNA polymerase sigma factor [Blastocatellia bacterium]|nr:sigma-70 family RNA polymerase sigma factor [Blastocatellia bacterium]HMV87776.1 sigma-70 family RNA polymerase sigma factor [Blastocatellia bacterium]HMX29347.1 sigma-70 family RNA polymerase sigma factor [Blastocatellia bacterium]HMZ20989.1 sigma-70 family RNA polymerase sigma factor [Blastocatellia bacterium]HNG30923.1 sigma-70 family RNA polymerase sigma factor [Blastocatellia bacterium]